MLNEEKDEDYKDLYGDDHVDDEFDEFMRKKEKKNDENQLAKLEEGHQLRVDQQTFLNKDVSKLDKRQRENFE